MALTELDGNGIAKAQAPWPSASRGLNKRLRMGEGRSPPGAMSGVGLGNGGLGNAGGSSASNARQGSKRSCDLLLFLTKSLVPLVRGEEQGMNDFLRVGIIGDFDPHLHYHLATNEALRHAAHTLSL